MGKNGKTYDNEEWVMKTIKAQGFVKDSQCVFQVPDDGSLVTMNLRSDDSFVEDEGMYRASASYSDFLSRHDSLHVLYLELGVGSNTPVIVKYPFWQMSMANRKAVYACINYGQAFCPEEIKERSICIDGDIGEVLDLCQGR